MFRWKKFCATRWYSEILWLARDTHAR
uniref:Uncharacterized protein n=1 Tax=Ralstonia solanacearum TaxID=305 RepID=A0A0S4WU26_RALSL|nr:protein of unknown function [Ralstonia solanacearum]